MNNQSVTQPVQRPENQGEQPVDGWTPAGPQAWALQTSDGYLGQARWRKTGAEMAVTRPDGTDLFRKTWGSREIFLHAWPGMFEWLKGRVSGQIAAERLNAATPAAADPAAPTPTV
jgi:hypothetical protein